MWISEAVNPDRSALGSEWQRVGSLDEHRETELWRVVQAHLGHRASSRARSLQAYVDVDPDSDGGQRLSTASTGLSDGIAGTGEFWLALQWAGPPLRTFFSTQPARVAQLARRPPELHPGLVHRVIPVGMQLRAGAGGFFDAA